MPDTELSPRVSSHRAGAGDLEGRTVCTLVAQRPGGSVDRGVGNIDLRVEGLQMPQRPVFHPHRGPVTGNTQPAKMQRKKMLTRQDSPLGRVVMDSDTGGPHCAS